MADRTATRIAAVAELARLLDGRVEPELLSQATELARKATGRMALSGNRTVIALGGATGSGKSSLFNAISETNLARPGVCRPTTAVALAATWGDPATELLDWLDIDLRHRVTSGTERFQDLVLIDLPDHDSTETKHQDEVERLVRCVDVIIWVVDPQKYADAALHEGYLRPMSTHAEVMFCVLNKAETLTPDERQRCLADLRRILDEAGLAKARTLAVSATTGLGIAELRGLIADLVAAKTSAGRRLTADLDRITPLLEQAVPDVTKPATTKTQGTQLAKALATAAGAEAVAESAAGAIRLRGGLGTGWPLLSWINALRRDPMRKHQRPLAAVENASTARVSNAIRTLTDEASRDLPPGWAAAIARAGRSEESELPHQLTEAIDEARSIVPKNRAWWFPFRLLQWLLLGAIIFGLGWLTLNFSMTYFQLPLVPTFPVQVCGELAVPTPTLLVLGGLAAGVILALVGKIFVALDARIVAGQVRKNLERHAHKIAEETVIKPVQAEISRYLAAREALARLRR